MESEGLLNRVPWALVFSTLLRNVPEIRTESAFLRLKFLKNRQLSIPF